jgi:hypothetical protein
MKPKTNQSPESVVREIKRKTRRKFNPEERISNHFRRPKRRREHHSHLPPGRYRSQPVLQIKQVVSTGLQKAVKGR